MSCLGSDFSQNHVNGYHPSGVGDHVKIPTMPMKIKTMPVYIMGFDSSLAITSPTPNATMKANTA